MTHPAFPGDFYQPGDSGYPYPDDGPNDPVPGPDPDPPPAAQQSLDLALRREETLIEALEFAHEDIKSALPHVSGAAASKLSAAAGNIQRRLRQNANKRERAGQG